jgi:hypothetical protein
VKQRRKKRRAREGGSRDERKKREGGEGRGERTTDEPLPNLTLISEEAEDKISFSFSLSFLPPYMLLFPVVLLLLSLLKTVLKPYTPLRSSVPVGIFLPDKKRTKSRTILPFVFTEKRERERDRQIDR